VPEVARRAPVGDIDYLRNGIMYRCPAQWVSGDRFGGSGAGQIRV